MSSCRPGQRLDRDARRARGLDDPLAHLARRGRDRDQHLVGPAVAEQLRQLGGRAEHADPVQAQVLLARVVVDEADRRVAEARVAQHLADHELRRVAGADDEHLLAARDDRPGRGRSISVRASRRDAGDEREAAGAGR